MTVRELSKDEYDGALGLAWKVFLEFEAPSYAKEGVDAFFRLIHDPQYSDEIRAYGAFDDETLIGLIATRNGGDRITLFFVDGRYHRQGIGKRLFALACADNKSGRLTVNSSPYAVETYRHLGFQSTDDEKISSGIRFTPMECILKNPDCPCKRMRCERHGDCAACREHHKTKKCIIACERLAKKEKHDD